MDLRRQRVNDRYAMLTVEQKAQRNAKRRENYARKKAGMSEQVKFTPVHSKEDQVQSEHAHRTSNMIEVDVGTGLPSYHLFEFIGYT